MVFVQGIPGMSVALFKAPSLHTTFLTAQSTFCPLLVIKIGDNVTENMVTVLSPCTHSSSSC